MAVPQLLRCNFTPDIMTNQSTFPQLRSCFAPLSHRHVKSHPKAFIAAAVALAFSFFLNGCMTPAAEMTPWVGHSSSTLIGQWGPPQHKTSDNKGGEIWIYQQHQRHDTPAYASSTGQTTAQGYGTVDSYGYGSAAYSGNYASQTNSRTTYMPSQSYVRTSNRSFYIDSSGMIYRVGWGGN